VFNFLKKDYYLLLIVPLLLNFFLNIFSGNYIYENLVIYDFISSLFIFIFLLSIGFSFKSVNSKMTLTMGIITYLISFFVVETVALFIYENMNLNITFLISNFLWILYFLIFLSEKKLLIANLSLYFLMIYYNNQYLDMMTINANLTMDVANVFFPNTLNIYENSYKLSVINPTMLGYPQFMSFIDSLIFKMSFGLEKYSFLISSSFLFFWLNLLLIYEFKVSKKNKLFVSLIFVLLILNSTWLQFLFTSSLMSERIAGYLLAGVLVTLFSIKKPNVMETSFIFFILGFMYITKQFFSVIVLILFVIFFITKKYRKGSIFILIPLIINEMTYLTYFSNVPREHHIRQIDFRDTILDLFLFRDLKLNNIIEITKNLWIDKPMTYLLLITFVTYFIALYKNKTNFESNTYFLISVLNIFFILLLYISAWRQMELESPIRYVYSFLIIYLMLIMKNLELKKN
jgi:hypothetical protein